jgi:flagellar hook-associated protein 3 FlgL
MSSSRINPNITPDLLAGLQTAQQQLNETVLELSTGRSINSPSDNPVGTADLVLNLSAQAQNDSFQQNISDLTTRMQTADSSLASAVNVINQAITLGVSGGGSDLTTSERGSIATQLQGIQQQLVSIANTSVSGTYLFAGTLVENPPFTLNPAAAAGVTYNGNSSVTSVEIDTGQNVNVNVPGDQLFLNPSGSLLGSINQLITALQTNTGISAANVALGQASSEFEAQTVNYGTSLSQLASTGTELATDGVQLAAQESAIDGADIAQVATQFTQANVAYQTVLEAEGKILSLPNLLSFIQ